MTNITMLTHGRPRLTEQALASLRDNTHPADYTLTAFDDEAQLGTGKARNRVIELAEKTYSGDLLYLSDNDVYFLPGWLATLIEVYQTAHDLYGVVAIGAYNHPFNQVYRRYPCWSGVQRKIMHIGLVHGLSTQSWLWSWEDARRFLPFKETPAGMVAMGDDVDMCHRIQAAGGKVAVVVPPLIVNTALTNTFGADVVGRDLLEKEPAYGSFRE